MLKNRFIVTLSISIVFVASLAMVYIYRNSVPGLETNADSHQRILNAYGKLPLSFIENRGQADTRVTHYIQSPGKSLSFMRNGHRLRLSQRKGENIRTHTVNVDLVGAETERVESLEAAPGIVSYFKGARENWETGIPTHSKIGYVRPWPGIDLSYDGSSGRLESIYTVAAHADPALIKLRYSGQDSLRLDDLGNLIYETSLGEVKETAPVAWQKIDGQHVPVRTAFAILDSDTVAFQVDTYDSDHELLIDPVFVYASFLGGDGDDRGSGLAVDSSGNAYLTAETSSTEMTFPDTVGPDTSFNGGSYDSYVAKFNAAGTSLVYAGYIGGSGNEFTSGIAVDQDGNAYVAGSTDSDENTFPVTTGPDTGYNGGTDGFVAKVNAAGSSLVYAGYIGGSSLDYATDVAVDGSGNAYVIGGTSSSEATFPETVGPSTTFSGGAGPFGSDAFVAKVNSSGSALTYAGYIGGSANDNGQAIALNGDNAYVTGNTDSDEGSFPVAGGPDLTYNGPSTDAFVGKVNSSGSALVYCGYVGGALVDNGFDIAVDNAGSAYITGRTASPQASPSPAFPVKVGPDLTFNNTNVGFGFDAFVAKVNPSGNDLVYAGFIGGGVTEYGRNIAVDSTGSAYLSGQTDSSNGSFPVVAGPDSTYNGGTFDGYVAKVSPSGRGLVYSGFIGGSSGDIARGIAVDSTGNAYVTGNTSSDENTFPDGDGFGSIPGFDQDLGSGGDAWVAKISAMAAPTLFDYDGDGKSDISVFRPSNTTWYLNRSTAGSFSTSFGNTTDAVVPADYDGDGKTDIAVYRDGSSGVWYRYFMGNGSNDNVSWGTTGDIPAPGDFDADGISDIAVFRGSGGADWYIRRSSDLGTTTIDFGSSGDLPAVGDYDGDGTDDVAVFRPSNSTWYIQQSSAGYFSLQWGSSGDKIVQADYDGDGKSDIAVFRPSTNVWYRYFMGPQTYDNPSFGSSGDLPTPGDYDGDGKFDLAIFRPSTAYWWLLQTTAGSASVPYGSTGDKPTPNAFVY